MKASSSRMAGIVLASGLSRRLHGQNKLLLTLAGETVIHRTVSAYVHAGLDPVLVVTGHESNMVRAALFDLTVVFVDNPEFSLGQSRGLVQGVSALPDSARGAVIGVGDQPFLTSKLIKTLCAEFDTSGRPIAAPRYAARRGNPVLFSRALFPDLCQVVGDVGGRPVVDADASRVTWVDFPQADPGLDLDTLEDYLALKRTSAFREE